MLANWTLQDGREPVLRPRALGKFIFLGDQKLYVRGVSYGTFRPDGNGCQFPSRDIVRRDLDCMSFHGVNCLRVYTVPPRWFLDEAHRRGLWVLIGLAWEQHVAFLEDRKLADNIETAVRKGVRSCTGHPAVLGYLIGNEIPAPIVRWHGHHSVEHFLERLYRIVKSEDPGSLVSYANYPTTEYLDLPFLDIVCYNVYLETGDAFRAYLDRLQNLAEDRPLLITEIGLDSRRHGELVQARVLEWEVRTAFAAGCAGACVFAWTDEWYRGGHDVQDWDFGLTRRDHHPKPALGAVSKVFSEIPFPANWKWPRISVVVCCYNEEGTIRDCLRGLAGLNYPDFEVIVIDNGSSDGTSAIALEFPFRVLRTENRGLSAARNLGIEKATGEIVAFIDADARPDPDWLTYLAAEFLTTSHVAVGGPNLPCSEDGLVAQCVAAAPGGPTHVLLSDREAEHIPGCNMAFYKGALDTVGGFDPQFSIAGDDVDICWRLQNRGWTLGFSSSALVWHHRRSRIWDYWTQQRNYGRAEALLERKWPEKYSPAGHARWTGRLYARSMVYRLISHRRRIYYGVWGSSLFQSAEDSSPSLLCSLAAMPEWYLGIALLAVLSVLGVFWTPLLYLAPFLVLALTVSIAQAYLGARRAHGAHRCDSRFQYWRLVLPTMFLHLLQPLARWAGRRSKGLVPWSRPARAGFPPRGRALRFWSEHWRSSHEWLQSLHTALRASRILVRAGTETDRWDLEVCGGRLAGARVRIAVEEHGFGRQLVRCRVWPRFSTGSMTVAAVSLLVGLGAALAAAWPVVLVLGAVGGLLLHRSLCEADRALEAVLSRLTELSRTWGALPLKENDRRMPRRDVDPASTR